MRVTGLTNMATSGRRRGARLYLARLRIEHRDGEIGVGEILLRHRRYLPGRHATHAFDGPIQQAPVETDGFEHAHLHGLIDNRAARVHIAGTDLPPDAFTFVAA